MKRLAQAEGSALIELSLIAPVMMLMLLGVVDLGIVLRCYIAVADSARAGAEAALASGHEADVNGWVQRATYAAGPIPSYSASGRSFCTCGPGGSTVSCSGSCSGTTVAQYAEVTVNANIPLAFKVIGLPATFPIKSVCRIRTKSTSGQ